MDNAEIWQIARQCGEYFDKIVNMFNQIGIVLPQLRDYQKLFESHERLALAISASYVDILEFCADAKAVFRSARGASSKIGILDRDWQTLWYEY